MQQLRNRNRVTFKVRDVEDSVNSKVVLNLTVPSKYAKFIDSFGNPIRQG